MIEAHSIDGVKAKGNRNIWIDPQRLSFANANSVADNSRQNKAHEIVLGLIPGRFTPNNAAQCLVRMQPRAIAPAIDDCFDPADT